LKDATNVNVIEKLTALSRTPQPTTWSNTLAPLARRAAATQARHVAQIAEHSQLADALNQIDVMKITSKVTADALPHIGRLAGLGRELRQALDSNFIDLRDAVRAAASATVEHSFRSAVESAEKYLPLAERTVTKIDELIAQLHGVLAYLESVAFVSPSYIVPPRPDGSMITQFSSKGAN
jgi:hypothetical protein